MKKRVLTLLVLVVALTFGVTTAVSAQNNNPTACFNLSQEDCDVLAAALTNTNANLTSFNASYTIDFSESNQVFVVGVNDAAVTVVGQLGLATDAEMAMTDPTQGAMVNIIYGVTGNLGPYGVTGGQSIVYSGGNAYWTDPVSAQWVGISADDAIQLGLGAAAVGLNSMSAMSIPGLDAIGAMLDPSMLDDPGMLLAGINPMILLSDPGSVLGGLTMGTSLFYAGMERLEDMEMMGQTMNGFALNVDLGSDLIAAALGGMMGDMAAMIPAEVWDDVDATATVTRWYGADDQLQHSIQATVDVTIGSTARTFFVSLIAPNAVSADAMLAPASFSIDLDAEMGQINEAMDIMAPEGASMVTLESIMGMMGSMTGGQ
jgi:hypothetical protein